MVLWSIVVYFPMAHMVWGKGGLLNAALGGEFPTLDFAGGTVVHITSGVSALVCALYLGKRLGYPSEPCARTAVVLSFIGAGLLWVGWFGFNAGSALCVGRLATSAFVQHALRRAAAASAGSSWNGFAASRASWARSPVPSPAWSPSPRPPDSSAHVCHRHRIARRRRLLLHGREGQGNFGYDDSLDAFGVHGVGGTLGALLTGVFASSAINPIFKDAAGTTLPSGLLEGNPHQLFNQLGGVAIAWGISIVGTLVLVFCWWTRPSVCVSLPDAEVEGLDLTNMAKKATTVLPDLRAAQIPAIS